MVRQIKRPFKHTHMYVCISPRKKGKRRERRCVSPPPPPYMPIGPASSIERDELRRSAAWSATVSQPHRRKMANRFHNNWRVGVGGWGDEMATLFLCVVMPALATVSNHQWDEAACFDGCRRQPSNHRAKYKNKTETHPTRQPTTSISKNNVCWQSQSTEFKTSHSPLLHHENEKNDFYKVPRFSFRSDNSIELRSGIGNICLKQEFHLWRRFKYAESIGIETTIVANSINSIQISKEKWGNDWHSTRTKVVIEWKEMWWLITWCSVILCWNPFIRHN